MLLSLFAEEGEVMAEIEVFTTVTARAGAVSFTRSHYGGGGGARRPYFKKMPKNSLELFNNTNIQWTTPCTIFKNINLIR